MIKQLMKLESMEIVSKSRFSKQLDRVQIRQERPRSLRDPNCKTDRYRLLRLLGNGWVVATPPQVRRGWSNRLLAITRQTNMPQSTTRAPAILLITSFEQGENWFYDYRTGDSFAGPKLPDPHADAHALDQPVPGPAGRIPVEWQSLLHE